MRRSGVRVKIADGLTGSEECQNAQKNPAMRKAMPRIQNTHRR